MHEMFDLSVLADNGMRRGRTTGTCAAAAAKAAAMLLVQSTAVSSAEVKLPGAEQWLSVPIDSVVRESGSVVASVIKYAGDDPDATDGARITVRLTLTDDSDSRFLAGPGVGVVTEPGIRVPIGEPAINPVPRQMILQAITDVAGDEQSFDIEVGCENGAVIAEKTFNPRLGIKGGISILGTTGIVEPLSLAAYMASVEVYINVALADGADCVAFLPGNIGLRYAGNVLSLPKKKTVHISNFLGHSLDLARDILNAAPNANHRPDIWLLGHPGKLAKALNGYWDTHSRSSRMAMPALVTVAQGMRYRADFVDMLTCTNTVEDLISVCRRELSALECNQYWTEVENRIARVCEARIGSEYARIRVKLFDMSAKALTSEQVNQTKSDPRSEVQL